MPLPGPCQRELYLHQLTGARVRGVRSRSSQRAADRAQNPGKSNGRAGFPSLFSLTPSPSSCRRDANASLPKAKTVVACWQREEDSERAPWRFVRPLRPSS
eukprot:3544043-Rhodomonas_salina.1